MQPDQSPNQPESLTGLSDHNTDRNERYLMQKTIQQTHDKHYASRLSEMLVLHRDIQLQRSFGFCAMPVHFNTRIGTDWQLRGRQTKTCSHSETE